MKNVEQYWYGDAFKVPVVLKALSYVFQGLVYLRRRAYKLHLFPSHRCKVPVIIVGNIPVGGTGKTPVVIWLAKLLKAAGYTPGIVSRGYGGHAEIWPQQVRPDSDPSTVGDEAIMIARRCGCPMAVGPDRVAALKALKKAHKNVNIIISDDGLQHYALRRDIEIAVVDGERRYGNGYCLPAGPLREPVTRLESVDFQINNGGTPEESEFAMHLKIGAVHNLASPEQTRSLDDFRGTRVHAVAGIGNPQRFFKRLQEQGITVDEHPFGDHHKFEEQEISFDDQTDVLMTEKDAVKCERFANKNHWYVTVDAVMDEKLEKALLALVEKKVARRKQRWIENYSTS